MFNLSRDLNNYFGPAWAIRSNWPSQAKLTNYVTRLYVQRFIGDNVKQVNRDLVALQEHLNKNGGGVKVVSESELNWLDWTIYNLHFKFSYEWKKVDVEHYYNHLDRIGVSRSVGLNSEKFAYYLADHLFKYYKLMGTEFPAERFTLQNCSTTAINKVVALLSWYINANPRRSKDVLWIYDQMLERYEDLVRWELPVPF